MIGWIGFEFITLVQQMELWFLRWDIRLSPPFREMEILEDVIRELEWTFDATNS